VAQTKGTRKPTAPKAAPVGSLSALFGVAPVVGTFTHAGDWEFFSPTFNTLAKLERVVGSIIGIDFYSMPLDQALQALWMMGNSNEAFLAEFPSADALGDRLGPTDIVEVYRVLSVLLFGPADEAAESTEVEDGEEFHDANSDS
jgi:hypothetical protein